MDLISLIKHDEGFKSKVYACPAGKLTIGYGRNLEDNGITEAEAEFLLLNDVKRAMAELSTINAYNDIENSIRRAVLVCLHFNLGFPRLLLFKRMFRAIADCDYNAAAAEILDSKVYRDACRDPNLKGLKTRYERLSWMMRTGDWPDESFCKTSDI